MKNSILMILALMLNVCVPAMAALTSVDKQYVVSRSLLVNGGFENGRSQWSASGGSFAVTTTSPIMGLVHATWDASASAQTLSSRAVAIPDGYKGQNGVASCRIKTASGTATHSLQAYDGSNILSTDTITSSTDAARTSVNFIFPSSGNIILRLYANANEPSIAIDDCYIDLAENRNIANVSQAVKAGTLVYAATTNCVWTSTSAAYAAFAADADCPTPTVTGSVTAAGTKIPGFDLSNMPPGKYTITALGTFYAQNTTSQQCSFRLSDGTNTSPGAYVEAAATTGQGFLSTVTWEVTYTTPASRSFQIQVRRGAGTGDCGISAGDTSAINNLVFTVTRFPSDAETAVNLNNLPWRVDANISGANPSLGTSNQASYVGIENGSLTLTNNSTGTLTAQIPCSSTNSPSGITCSVGNESVGVSFTIPRAGAALACASFSHAIGNGASGNVAATFQIVETPANAQTISQEGKSRIQSEFRVASTGHTNPLRVCGTFNFSSSGQKTLRLMYEQLVTATVSSNTLLADADATTGQRDIHWEVYPIDQQFPAPVLVGSVTSQSTGAERIERATVTCSGSSSITRQSGSWISSIGNVATGACSVTIATGIFSATPSCVATADQNSSAAIIGWHVLSNSATSLTLGCRVDTSGTPANCTANTAHIICMGPR